MPHRLSTTRRVVLVVGSLHGGGAERAIVGMANFWAAQNWTVSIAVLSGSAADDAYDVSPHVQIVRLGFSANGRGALGKLFATCRQVTHLRAHLRMAAADAVISFIHITNIVTLLAATGLGLRVVVSERGGRHYQGRGDRRDWNEPLSMHWRVLRRWLYRRAHAVTALNATTAQWLASECTVHVDVVPLALRTLPAPDATREPMILGVGRLHGVKGFDVLLEAFAVIADRFPDWHVTIIGDGPQRVALQAQIERLSLAQRVTLAGHQKDVVPWLARAGLVVLPSRAEAFGNAVLESLAMGAPVIATRCLGPRELIEDGVNGRLVAIDDVAQLSDAMATLMADPTLRQRLGDAARGVRQKYSEASVMRRWESLAFEV